MSAFRMSPRFILIDLRARRWCGWIDKTATRGLNDLRLTYLSFLITGRSRQGAQGGRGRYLYGQCRGRLV